MMIKTTTNNKAIDHVLMVVKPLIWGVTLLALLAGCSGNAKKDEVSSTTVVDPLRFEAKSRCGNDPQYTVAGQTYQVLNSAAGYREQGIATWYGAEYQGMETAGCEQFDMYAYTAAHKTLPLPSFVRVTNTQNNRSVIVRVNDRGPFDQPGVIQLSFAAANALGVSRQTVIPVRLEGMTQGEFGDSSNTQAAAKTPSRRGPPKLTPKVMPQPASPVARPTLPSMAKPTAAQKQQGQVFYVVAGTFAKQEEALDLFIRLTSAGLGKAEMASAPTKQGIMHQVRIGPLYNQDQIDNVKDVLVSNGLSKFKVVAVKK